MTTSLSYVVGQCITWDDTSNVSKLQDLMDIFYYIRIKNTGVTTSPVTHFSLKELYYISKNHKKNTKEYTLPIMSTLYILVILKIE